ncbi:uncharacterized protein FIBRA_05442 [Fibroporia radiculosa]|uniref:Uncharacterized protein n=1 Tax=Fibroporia radiculosa TaxID=599839 RepID=J4H3I1_9APHY|nr:uncharacterized protein FIBRA_05442 [Fibroporia radiculosa]CCM03314.1 predicted protein [Fibroporia radiculosa]
MSSATSPSSSPSSTAPPHKHKKRTPVQISKSVYRLVLSPFSFNSISSSRQILGPLTDPLPPTLPPSPPSSRSASPAPLQGSKRKLESSSEQLPNKKPRTSIAGDQATTSRLPPVPSFPQTRPSSRVDFAIREPSEDGELSEDPFRSSIATMSSIPVRRPRRGSRLPANHYDELYDKYFRVGRLLKHSGQERMLSMHPPSHKHYKPLQNPPAPGTPYHKYGHLIARLEALDALLCFTYAFWARDYGKRTCSNPNWRSAESYLAHCKGVVWRLEDIDTDQEKAFHGLILMIEGFIHARIVRFAVGALQKEDERLIMRIWFEADAAAEREKLANLKAQQAAPTSMLPSPASSAGSTPSSVQGTPNPSTGTPSHGTSQPSASAHSRPQPQQERHAEQLPPPQFTVAVNANVIAARRSQSMRVNASAYLMDNAQKYVTLPIMAKHFPRTFTRMVHSRLTIHDEHEPEIEDEEGELFWPGQCITGEGIGWVCLMGKAMIKEFGKTYGYKGLDGAIAKEDEGSSPAAAPALSPDVASLHR